MPKTKKIHARVSDKMFEQVTQAAHIAGETEAYIVREALRAYFAPNEKRPTPGFYTGPADAAKPAPAKTNPRGTTPPPPT